MNRKVPESLSYHETATVNGEPRRLAIINSDNLDTKTLLSLPEEDLPHGGLVYWRDNFWLITAKDANNELYTRCTMRQCNHLLRFISGGNIIERWCIVEDGTKYLTGELEDRDFIVKRGDTRISMIIAKDEYTVDFGRDSRFIIDDEGVKAPLAYRLTKPLKTNSVYGGRGVYAFVLQECNTEDADNLVLQIPDYYKYFNEDGTPISTPPSGKSDGRWL